MSYITRRPPAPQFCPDPALALFHAARVTMNRALIAWINAGPSPEDLDVEADGTCSIVRQLIALARSEGS